STSTPLSTNDPTLKANPCSASFGRMVLDRFASVVNLLLKCGFDASSETLGRSFWNSLRACARVFSVVAIAIVFLLSSGFRPLVALATLSRQVLAYHTSLDSSCSFLNSLPSHRSNSCRQWMNVLPYSASTACSIISRVKTLTRHRPVRGSFGRR